MMINNNDIDNDNDTCLYPTTVYPEIPHLCAKKNILPFCLMPFQSEQFASRAGVPCERKSSRWENHGSTGEFGNPFNKINL